MAEASVGIFSTIDYALFILLMASSTLIGIFLFFLKSKPNNTCRQQEYAIFPYSYVSCGQVQHLFNSFTFILLEKLFSRTRVVAVSVINYAFCIL